MMRLAWARCDMQGPEPAHPSREAPSLHHAVQQALKLDFVFDGRPVWHVLLRRMSSLALPN